MTEISIRKPMLKNMHKLETSRLVFEIDKMPTTEAEHNKSNEA